MALTTVACVDEPMSPMLHGTTLGEQPIPGRVFRQISQDELHRLERESELGYPSTGSPGFGQGLGDHDNEMVRLAPDASVPDSITRSARELPHARSAPSAVARSLDIPEVCHRDSPALDFDSGWIFFDDDCDALLAAKDQLRGTVALNWDTATVMTDWEGVILGTFGVERLYLHFRGLDGSIPPELGALDNLDVLSLGRNELTGEIPPELGSMRSLERLYLQQNQLTGGIPPEIGRMRSLERLYLWSNQLTGAIPAELGSLSQLERLQLAGNQFTGEIPPELGRLSRLVWLLLQRNQLTGPIPDELGRLTRIERLSLSRNQLTGDIPLELGRLRYLHYLWLYGNELTGSIPNLNTGAWEQLRVLWLHDNQLTGEVPADLQNTDLYSLSVSTNDGLTGPLPLELQTLLLDAFYWGTTGLCSPPDPSFQAWLESIDEESYSGGPVCDSGGGGGGTRTYQTGETISTLPTGRWTPDVLSSASFQYSSGQVTIGFNNGGYIEEAGVRYTCRASGGCRVVNRVVTQGTIEASGGGGGGGSNRSPETSGSVSDRTMTAGQSATLDASSYFSDPDGDRLTYTARSSSTSAATVSVSGSEVTVTAVAQGSATVRITATDPGGLSAEQSFTVTVQSSAACTEDLGTIPDGTAVTRAASWDGSCPSVHYSGGEFARYYSFTLSERLSVAIDLTSPSVDTWLALRRGGGTGVNLIESDNNGGTGTNARIERTLATGEYTIEATTLRGGATGPFTLTLTVGGGGSAAPDLVVQSPAVDDDTPEAGASFTFSATVRNGGEGQSGSTTLRYYRSSNATISSSDTEVGTDRVGALRAGESSAETVALTAPSQEDTYYFGACVDSVDGESNTDNNCSDGVEVEVAGGGTGREGECVQGATYGRGESCDVYGTGSSSKLTFTVLSDGRARLGFITAGNGITMTGTINGVKYHFVASHQGGGVWKVDEYVP